jgi:hypothetical protein
MIHGQQNIKTNRDVSYTGYLKICYEIKLKEPIFLLHAANRPDKKFVVKAL